MIVQEVDQCLTSRASGACQPHVFLDGPFAQLDTQLEQFTLNPLSIPQWSPDSCGIIIATDDQQRANGQENYRIRLM